MTRRTALVWVAAAWTWLLAAPFAVVGLIAIAHGIGYAEAMKLVNEISQRHPYAGSYIEFVAAGMIPLIFTLTSREGFSIYGLVKDGLARSLLPALPLGLARLWLEFSDFHQIVFSTPSFDLAFPSNVWHAAWGAFAYGPLEAFFVIWLIVNTDRAAGTKGKVLSVGLLETSLLFGAVHLALSPRGGLPNALNVAGTWLLLGLVFNWTRNAVGPMIVWTFGNKQVWLIAAGCLR